MWKKTLLALATVVALAGFGTVAEPTPAAAAPGVHRMPHAGVGMARPRGGVVMARPRVVAAPAHRWHRGPGIGVRHPGYRHHHRGWRGGWYGGYWYGGTGWYYPPGVYTAYSNCWIVRKKVRVWTDDGWRRRWRKVRYCS